MVEYNPTSGILLLTICSLNKVPGGDASYDKSVAFTERIPYGLVPELLENRELVRMGIKDPTAWESVDWQGIPLDKLEYNQNLVEGADFGGKDKRARYLPAIERYAGRFFQTLGPEGRRKLLSSANHILFISGLYGLVTPTEPIQLYSCPLEPPVADIWTKDGFLTKVFVAYLKQNGIHRVFDLTAMSAYRNLIDWDMVRDETGSDVLHCFGTMGAGDDALIPFGMLVRDYLLEASGAELLSLKSGTRWGTVVFHSVPALPKDLPEELRAIERAKEESPFLEKYDVGSVRRVVQGGFVPPVQKDSTADSWHFAQTSEFRKNIRSMGDNKLRGRVLTAIIEICQNPMTFRRGVIEPLECYKDHWRYRFRDNYRLIYRPDPAENTVYLVWVGPKQTDDVYRNVLGT